MNRRNMIAASIASMLGTQLHAQGGSDYPRRPVTLIFPFPAGSVGDPELRELGNFMQKATGQPLVMDYRAGASGTIGTQLAQRAAPDGYTLLYGSTTSIVTSPPVIMKSPYSGRTDFEPITAFGRIDGLLAVPANSKYRTSQELADALKANPGKYNFASIGNGSLSHLAMEAIAIKAGTKLVHVPYPSSPQAMTAIIRNDAQTGCLPAISVVPQAKAGSVKILAVSTAKRSPYLPDVPTLKESGIDVEADAWMGLIAPGGMPKAMVDKINKMTGSLKDMFFKKPK